MTIGLNIQKSIVNGYEAPNTLGTDPTKNKLCNDNSRAINAILCELANLEFVKVMHCKSTKEISDKIQVIYEGDERDKQYTLQTYIGQVEKPKMKVEENVAACLLRVDEVVNTIRGLGEEFDDLVIVQKVLRSLSLRFDAKVSALEQ